MSRKPQKEPILSAPETPGGAAQLEFSLLHVGYLRILAVQFGFGFTYSSFLLLPKFLKTELHASAAEIGWVAGIALVAAAVVSPFVGSSSAYVERRTLLGFSLLAAGICGVLFTFAKDVGPLVYVLRILQGLSWVLVFNCTATMTADIVPQHRMSQAIGFLGVAMMATNALAPALVEPAAAVYGWGLAFGVPACLALLALLLIPSLPRDLKETETGPVPQLPRSSHPVFYAALVMGAGLGVMFTFTQPFALSLGATRVGDFFFGYVATALFVRIALSGLSDRIGPGRVATLSLVPYALVLLLTANLTPNTLPLLGAGLGASHGLMYPALMATGLAGLSRRQRLVFMGWVTFAFNAGFATCVLGLGPVADAVGYPTVFLATGIFVASGLVPMGLRQSLSRKTATQGLG
jgi:predicted MFS family arabinose efflux permease